MLKFSKAAVVLVIWSSASVIAAAQGRVAGTGSSASGVKPSPSSPGANTAGNSLHRAPAAARAVRVTGSQQKPTSMPNRTWQPAQFSMPVPPSSQPLTIASRPVAPVSEPVAETPATPAAPLPGADKAGEFSVDYRAGMLSVMAQKAELGKIINLVGTKTGATVEVAPDVTAEPVIAQLGPGTPRQILSQLLDSPHLAYIVMGSDEDGTLQRIVVRKRNSFSHQPVAAMRAPAPSLQEAADQAQPQPEQAQTSNASEQQQTPTVEPQGNPPLE